MAIIALNIRGYGQTRKRQILILARVFASSYHARMAKKGRKPIPFVFNGRTIDGLARDKDGRYRIIATGKRFSCDEPAAAVARFLAETDDSPLAILTKPTTAGDELEQTYSRFERLAAGEFDVVEEGLIIAWAKKQFIERPQWIADRLEMPGLAEYRYVTPSASLKLSEAIEVYKKYANVQKETKGKVIKDWNQFASLTGAATLKDITTDRVIHYRDTVHAKGYSAEFISNKFGRVKTVLLYCSKNGKNPKEIADTLATLKVLDGIKTNGKQHNPKPISRDDWRKLLDTAQGEMRAVLLLSLNLCCYLNETLGLEWDDFDLDKKTFVGNRNKTKVVKVGYLWDETIAELRKLPRGNLPLLFVSSHGTRYNRTSYQSKFRRFKHDIGLGKIEFSQLRDGAYTAAATAGEEKYARILAGHRAAGEQDRYVKATPHLVKVATDAVYREYMTGDAEPTTAKQSPQLELEPPTPRKKG